MFTNIYHELPLEEQSSPRQRSKFEYFSHFQGLNELDSDFNYYLESNQDVVPLQEEIKYQNSIIKYQKMSDNLFCIDTKIELSNHSSDLQDSCPIETIESEEVAGIALSTNEEQPAGNAISQQIDDEMSNENSNFPNPASKSKKTKRIKLKQNGQPAKEDKSKNVATNLKQHIVRKMIKSRGEDRIQKLLRKYSATEQDLGLLLFSLNNADIGLGKLYDTLNYHIGEESLRSAKHVLHEYFTWYLRNRYQIHILHSSKIGDSKMYIEEKNKLLYILSLTQEGKEKIRVQYLKNCEYARHFAQI